MDSQSRSRSVVFAPSSTWPPFLNLWCRASTSMINAELWSNCLPIDNYSWIGYTFDGSDKSCLSRTWNIWVMPYRTIYLFSMCNFGPCCIAIDPLGNSIDIFLIALYSLGRIRLWIRLRISHPSLHRILLFFWMSSTAASYLWIINSRICYGYLDLTSLNFIATTFLCSWDLI